MLAYWYFLVPPLAGGIIGYFTNDLAIKMLFRPYQPLYFGKQQLPFTPGLIPRNQGRLAQRVADTIMGSLLTPEEIQALARRLLQPERVQGAIQWLLESSLAQFGDGAGDGAGGKEGHTVKVLANILRDLTGESLPRLIKVLSRREDFLEAQIDKIFDRVLLEYQIGDTQARQITDWLLQVVLPPNTIRQAVVDALTDRNIQVIDEIFREKTTGTYWVVANLLGLRNALTRLRAFCLDERETANSRLAELILSLEVRKQLRAWLQTRSLQNLPVATVRQLRQTIRTNVRDYLQESGAKLLQDLGQSMDWDEVALLIVRRVQASSATSESLEVIARELALILERYLEKDLESIVAKTLPILAIDKAISERVNATSPEQLEASIQGIVKSELQAIVNIGGILGIVIGLAQAIFLYFQ
ncbi:MAG: DUF445 family protein [Cyanobacteria bacterium J06641_5]